MQPHYSQRSESASSYRRDPAVSFFDGAGVAAPVRMPRTSSSRMMMNSSPSILISVPEYLPNRMRSPSFTSRGRTLPSSLDLPLPAAITSPSCGLSFAESGMMIPPRVVSASSIRLTRIRSCRGVRFAMQQLLSDLSSLGYEGLVPAQHL